MSKLEIHFNEADTAISVMREVAAWGRAQGYRVWPEEWLTKEELITSDAQPENFCIGTIDNEIACAFILQWADGSYWPDAPKYKAAYLHKFCVRRKFAGMGMTKFVTEAIRAECRRRAHPPTPPHSTEPGHSTARCIFPPSPQAASHGCPAVQCGPHEKQGSRRRSGRRKAGG